MVDAIFIDEMSDSIFTILGRLAKQLPLPVRNEHCFKLYPGLQYSPSSVVYVPELLGFIFRHAVLLIPVFLTSLQTPAEAY